MVADCYPTVGSEAFGDYAGGVAGCWMRSDVCAGGAMAEAFARKRLSAAGWTVARVILRERVSAETYASKAEERELLEDALRDGYFADIDAWERKVIGKGHLDNEEIAEAAKATARRFFKRGGVSLFSKEDRQWANGVSAECDEFVPLWVTEESARAWLEHWPGYHCRHLTAKHLGHSSFLGEIDEAYMWVGLGITDSLLTMCHPIWIRETVARQLRKGCRSS